MATANIKPVSEGVITPGARECSASSTLSSPMFPEVGVIALVPDEWQLQWQPRHQVMTRLARYFPVLWMNPAEEWRRSFSLSRIFTRREESPGPERGFVVHTPSAFLPKLYSPRWLAQLSFRKRIEHARAALLRRGCRKIVLYLWRPEFAPALDCIPHDLSCYHIDDEYTFSPVDQPVPEQELNLIKKTGVVFIHSPALLQKKGKINPCTLFTPNGVDFDLHAQPVSPPSDIADIPYPRIGYSGHIKKQLDWMLLHELTARHPELFFVFVGSANAHPEIVGHINELSRRKNVRFLGAKTTRELAAYPQHFDVCIMPYARDDYTKYIYPLKLHEYLAGGRPVVGTRIASLEAFSGVVRLAESVDQWSSALADSLAAPSNSVEARAKRQAVAREHDWFIIVRKIALALAERLDPHYAAVLREAGVPQVLNS